MSQWDYKIYQPMPGRFPSPIQEKALGSRLVRCVASFMGIEDEASIRNAVTMSRFDFMKENQKKFASHRTSQSRNRSLGLPEATRLQRIHTGSATKGRDVMDDCAKEAIRKMWTEIITKELGFQDYDELRYILKTGK